MERGSFFWTVLMLLQLVSSSQAIDCSDISIGVENKDIITDSSFNASSYYSSAYMPWYARLGNIKPWASKDNKDPDDYLQIDLGRLYMVCGVRTQGTAYSHLEWVTTFKLRFSLDGLQWVTYKENGKDKVFSGNSDQSTVVTNSFPRQPVLARYIQFLPVSFHNHKTIRVAVFGVVKECNNKSFDVTPKYIPDHSYSASTIYDCRYPPWRARFFSRIGWAPINNNDPTDYIQLDLTPPYSVCAIGTQGSAAHGEWVTSYKLNTTTDGTTWNTYQTNGAVKYFPGNNKHRNVLLVHYINTTIARSVRFIPVSYVGHKTMRVGLFGHDHEENLRITKEKMEPLLKACIGDNVTISCYATGPQPIKYSWSLNGSVIDNKVTRQVDNVLIVRPQAAKHFGTYICEVSRGVTSDSYGVKLQQITDCSTQQGNLIFEAEKMTSLVNADIGDKVILVCFAISSRPIKYRWTKDGQPINNAGSTTVHVIGNVVIVRTKAEKDFGNFVCAVDDGKNSISYTITLKLFDSIKPSTAARKDMRDMKTRGGNDVFVPVILILVIQLIMLAMVLVYLVSQRFKNGINSRYAPTVKLSHIRGTNDTERAQESPECTSSDVSRFSHLGRQNQYSRFGDD